MNNFKLEVHFNFAWFVLLAEYKEAVSIITQQRSVLQDYENSLQEGNDLKSNR